MVGRQKQVCVCVILADMRKEEGAFEYMIMNGKIGKMQMDQS